MGITAENIAEKYSISREAQDEFALSSQEKTKNAIEKGYFEKEIAPYPVKTRKGIVEFKIDEHPRETTLEKLALLNPYSKKAEQSLPGTQVDVMMAQLRC